MACSKPWTLIGNKWHIDRSQDDDDVTEETISVLRRQSKRKRRKIEKYIAEPASGFSWSHYKFRLIDGTLYDTASLVKVLPSKYLMENGFQGDGLYAKTELLPGDRIFFARSMKSSPHQNDYEFVLESGVRFIPKVTTVANAANEGTESTRNCTLCEGDAGSVFLEVIRTIGTNDELITFYGTAFRRWYIV
tara:strand:- start:111 stop:683 length:573 start_codon:yes stop_codon:yes gene_type:complete